MTQSIAKHIARRITEGAATFEVATAKGPNDIEYIGVFCRAAVAVAYASQMAERTGKVYTIFRREGPDQNSTKSGAIFKKMTGDEMTAELMQLAPEDFPAEKTR